jgi:hypothetical protein
MLLEIPVNVQPAKNQSTGGRKGKAQEAILLLERIGQ